VGGLAEDVLDACFNFELGDFGTSEQVVEAREFFHDVRDVVALSWALDGRDLPQMLSGQGEERAPLSNGSPRRVDKVGVARPSHAGVNQGAGKLDEVVQVQVDERHLGSHCLCPHEPIRDGHPVHGVSPLDASARSVSQRICECLPMPS